MTLKASLGDIIEDTNKGKLGAVRIVKLWGKLKGPAGDVLKDTAKDLASEGAKAILKIAAAFRLPNSPQAVPILLRQSGALRIAAFSRPIRKSLR